MSNDPTDLKAADLAREEKAQTSRMVASMEANDWKWLMSQKRGRRLVWRLLAKTGLYRSSFTGNSQTFFNEGQRNIGLLITAILSEHCLADYALMQTEQREHE